MPDPRPATHTCRARPHLPAWHCWNIMHARLLAEWAQPSTGGSSASLQPNERNTSSMISFALLCFERHTD